MTTHFYPNPENPYHRLLFFIMAMTILIAIMSGCRGKETVIQREYITKVDSSMVAKLDSLKEISESKEQAYLEYISIIEKELANKITGRAGKPKPISTLKEETLTLTSGKDTILLTGKWEYVDYVWKVAERSSKTTSKTDSFRLREESYKERIKYYEEREKRLEAIKDESIEKVVKYKRDLRFAMWFFIAGIVITLLIRYRKVIFKFFGAWL